MKEGDFGIAKSKTSFTSIGADHQIEQENWVLKVLGGIKGIYSKFKSKSGRVLPVKSK